VLSGLTAAVVAASPFGVLENLQKVAQLPLATAAAEPAPMANPDPNAAPPFVLKTDPADVQQAVKCMAQAVYFEAGFQPVEGQRAIAQVILNRARDKHFPGTVCGVVYEGWKRKTGCQFSFVCDGSLWRRPPNGEELASAEKIAADALNGYVVAAVGTATHYHTWKIDPYWNDSLVKTAQIGDHIFYRWPGKAGQPAALSDDFYDGDEVQVAHRSPRQATMLG
jgi:spore germination cell wall hydrolase CwlJ-like protein